MKTDPRTRVWMIERCPKDNPPLRRNWRVSVMDSSFDTRRGAMEWIAVYRAHSEVYLYRARQYMPVPKG